MRTKVKIEGLKDLENALKELPKATGKNVLRRLLFKVGKPIEEAMENRAPRGVTGRLVQSIVTGTKLNPEQAKEHRVAVGTFPSIKIGGFKSDAAQGVYVFVGPAPGVVGIAQEFGTSHHAPHPFARPAWDENQRSSLETIKEDLAAEIEKARARLAKKAQREALKMK